MNTIISVLIGIASSFVASFIFWIVSFRIHRSKVLIVNKIEKSPSHLYDSSDKEVNRYRIRLMNIKRNDLFEISIHIRLYLFKPNSKTNDYTTLDTENNNYLPILYGKRSQNLNRHAYTTLTLYPNEKTLIEVKKTHYKVSKHFKNLDEDQITLDEIFEEFKDRLKIQIFVFGNEDVTGARRCFYSEMLDYNSIVEGKFNNPILKESSSYKKFKKDIQVISNEKGLI